MNAAAASDFEIRLAENGDREGLFHVLKHWFPATLQTRYDWLYAGNPHGRAVSWLAVDRATGEAVGCTSVFPRKVVVEGRRRIGSIGGDCFILPQYRRRGIATALHRESAASMRERGVEFMYGPPEPANLAALLKAGSRIVGRFATWVRPLRGRDVVHALLRGRSFPMLARVADAGLSVVDLFLRPRPKTPVVLEPMATFGPEFDAFFEESAASQPIVCVRDSAYLTWRYLTSPSRTQQAFAARSDGRLMGFVALEVDGDRAFLIDVFCPAQAEAIDALLGAVMNQAQTMGAARLIVDITEGCALSKRLFRHGFLRREREDFQVLAAPDDPQAAALSAPGAWHFCTADKDIDTLFRADYETSLEERPSQA